MSSPKPQVTSSPGRSRGRRPISGVVSPAGSAFGAEGSAPAGPQVEGEACAASDWRAKLGRHLLELDLPSRLANWADRQGIVTLGALLEHDPRALLGERNLGRKSIAAADRTIEQVFGCSWLEARERIALGAPDREPPLATGAEGAEKGALSGDDAPVGAKAGQGYLAALLGPVPPAAVETLRAMSAGELDFSARLRSFIAKQQCTTVGTLLDVPVLAWQAKGDVRRSSVMGALALLRAEVERIAAGKPSKIEALAASPSLPALWREVLAELDPTERIVLTRRAGVGGEAETLPQIGETLGVTGERVRQIEARALGLEVVRRPLESALAARLEASTGGEAAWFERLAADPFWQPFERAAPVLIYLFDRGLGAPWRLVTVAGERLLVPAPSGDVVAAWGELERRLAARAYPAPWRTLRDEIIAFAGPFGRGVGAAWCERLEPAMHIKAGEGGEGGEGGEPVVVSFGEDSRAKVLAILRASDTPVHIDEVVAKLGHRFDKPEGVIHFGRGRLGLEQHFPEMKAWREKLVPLCTALMSLGAERQWSAFELHELLHERGEVPAWLGPWHLGALLRGAPELDYLGRLRVKLRDAQSGERLFFRDILLELLTTAEGPLDEADIFGAVAQRTSLHEYTVRTTLQRAPFVRVGPRRWGLLDRDVPGGEGALAAACNVVAGELEARQEGLSAFEALGVVRRSGGALAGWSEELVLSACRFDERFELAGAGIGVGLAAWGAPRVQSRRALVEQMVHENGGRVDAERVLAALARRFGVQAPRNRLSGLLGSAFAIDRDGAVRLNGETAHLAAGRPGEGVDQAHGD
jgi:sigma-70-like protein/RNA polymerase alpha subunit